MTGPEPTSFPLPRTCPFSPPPEYARLREEEPVHRVRLALSGREAWAVSRAEDVRTVLGARTMSSSVKLPGYPLQFPVPDEVLQTMDLPLVAMDPPDHTVRRRFLVPEFTARKVSELRPRVQEIVDDGIDAMIGAGAPADLVEALAIPVPSQVFCEVLGVPEADIDRFRSFAEQTVRSDVPPEAVAAATAEIDAYLGELVARKTGGSDDDVLARIVARNEREGVLDDGDVVALGRMLLFGGFDTIANMIALGTAMLLQRPEDLDALRSDAALWPGAIEELLRYLSIADSATARVATEDVTIAGRVIPAGDGIIALNGSANRDPEVFEKPDEFDIRRPPERNLAFGHGIHQCPGANLVRLELAIVFETLFRRLPTLALDVAPDRLEFKSHTLIHGMTSLPVRW